MWTQTHTGEKADRNRGWSDVSTGQGMPSCAGKHQKLGRGKEGFCPENQRGRGPADTLILDVWLPALGDNQFLLL